MVFGVLGALIARIVRTALSGKLTQHSANTHIVEELDEILSVSDRSNGPQISVITPLILQSCGINRLHHFEQDGSIADLEAAILSKEPTASRDPKVNYDLSAITSDDADLDDSTRHLKDLLKTQRLDHPLRRLIIKTLAEALRLRSENILNLNTTIQLERQALDIRLPDDPGRGICCARLAATLVRRSRMKNSISDLDDAVGLYEEVLQIRPSGHLERLTALADLAKALRYRYALTRNQMDLDHVSVYEREAQGLCSLHQTDLPSILSDQVNDSHIVTLTVQSLHRYSVVIQIDMTNTVGQLKEMILYKTGVVEGVYGLFCDGHVLSDERTIADCVQGPDSVVYLIYNASATTTESNTINATIVNTHVLNPLNEVQSTQSESEDGILRIRDPHHTTSEDDYPSNLVAPRLVQETMEQPQSEEVLQVQVTRLPEMGFSSKGEITLALVAASWNFDRAVGLLLNGIPHELKAQAASYVVRTNSVGSIRMKRELRHSGSDAICVGDRTSDPSASSRVSMNDEHVDSTIRVYQENLKHTPPGHPRRAEILNRLAGAIKAHFDESGNHANLETAIKYYEESLRLLPLGHSHRSVGLSDLAAAIEARFYQSGDRADLETAIKYFEESLQLHSPRHLPRSTALNNLSGALQARFDKFGDYADLVTAIRYNEEALHLCPPGHPRRSVGLAHLAGALKTHFDESGDRAGLETAINYYEEALQLCPLGHPDRLTSLGNLASAIKTRFDHPGDRPDLEAALKHYEEALRLCPWGHPYRAASLDSLAGVIKARFDQSGDCADLVTTIKYNEEAVELCPPGHHHRPASLGSLADAIKARFDQYRDRVDLETAIEYHEETLELCPLGHPHRSVSLNNLAGAMKRHYSSSVRDILAVQRLSKTLQPLSKPASVGPKTARTWMRLPNTTKRLCSSSLRGILTVQRVSPTSQVLSKLVLTSLKTMRTL
ncbi:hypothetical protein FRB96_003220 [Tulasnella sp. 330]|nr:hypothetical protein FRB96_003220 [Tulasnella sp. 330]